MADITIYKPAAMTVQVFDGDPPVDQTALVAQLQSDLATMTADRDAQKARADKAESDLATLKATVNTHADALKAAAV